MEEINSSLLFHRIPEQIFDWLDTSYDFFIYYLSLIIFISLCNNPLQSFSFFSFPGVLLFSILIIFTGWFIVHKKFRPYKYENEIPYNPAKIKIQNIFLIRLILYTCLIIFTAILVRLFSSTEVIYQDYSFLHAAFAGELYLLFQYRRIVYLKKEHILAPFIDVSISFLIFLMFWGNILLSSSIFLPYLDRLFHFLMIFLLYIFSLGENMPWQVILVFVCTLIGTYFSLKVELRRYKKTIITKLIKNTPLIIILIICLFGCIRFIQIEIIQGNIITNRYNERFHRYNYRKDDVLFVKEEAFKDVLNLQTMYPRFSEEPLRGSSLPDFNVEKTIASTTHCKSKNECFDIKNILDNNPKTAWLAAKDEEAEKPILTLQLKNNTLMYGVVFRNGFQQNNDIFSKHNRPLIAVIKGYNSVNCIFSNTYFFPEKEKEKLIELQNKAIITRLEIHIQEQYSGTYNAFCSISDIVIIGRFLP